MIRKFFSKVGKSTLELAMERAALASGECARSAVMAEFYSQQLKNVDHEKDWWRYAELKQKQFDSLHDQTHYSQQADEAMAKVAAQQASENVADSGRPSPPASSHPDSQAPTEASS